MVCLANRKCPRVACISCHTGMTYLMTRPVLRRALHEGDRTKYAAGLLDSLRSRLAKRNPRDSYTPAKEPAASQGMGVETLFSALFLAQESGPENLSADAQQAFDRMWSLQVREGNAKGSWPCYRSLWTHGKCLSRNSTARRWVRSPPVRRPPNTASGPK